MARTESCRGARLTLSLAALLGVWPRPALGDVPAPSSAEASGDEAPPKHAAYDAEIEAALLEYEHGHFLEAREHFQLAHAARPSARTLRGLGKVEFELRHYVEARSLLGAALDSPVNPLDAELRDEVERLLARAGTYIAELQVTAQPAHATLELDGAPIAPGQVVSVVVGDHLLEASAPGYVMLRRPVSLKGGEQHTLQLALLPGAAQPSRDAPRAPDDSPRGRRLKVALGVTCAVLVLAGAAAGVTLAIRGQQSHELTGGSTGLVLVNR